MNTLLLRLAAPLQAWGTDSKFETRRTGKEPSKSGVIGLLAAALGRQRGESLEDLVALQYGVRVEREGQLLRDFHTAHSAGASYITNRHYLADAVFLVGVASDDEPFLREIDVALHHPGFPLFLGRRSCPPTLPISLGVRSGSLLETLQSEPWLLPEWQRRKEDGRLRLITDCLEGESSPSSVRDVPISFDQNYRRFRMRMLKEWKYVPVMQQHDPMAEL